MHSNIKIYEGEVYTLHHIHITTRLPLKSSSNGTLYPNSQPYVAAHHNTKINIQCDRPAILFKGLNPFI